MGGERSNTVLSDLAETPDKPSRRKRPLSIWIAGVAFMVLPVLQVSGIVLAHIQGRADDASPDLRLVVGVCIGLVGLGIILGNRPSLIVAKVLSILGILFVGFSIFAATVPYRAAGPNASHLVGLLNAIGWLFSWSGKANTYCSNRAPASAQQGGESV